MRWINQQRRVFFIFLVFSSFFFLLTLRLGYLQIVRGACYAELAVMQRSQRLILNSGRGDILDRSGLSLLDSYSKEVLVVFPAQIMVREESLLKTFSLIPGIESILDPPYGNIPFIASKKIDSELARFLEEQREKGLVLSSKVQRYGPESLAVHVVGHLHRDDFTRGEKGIEYRFNEKLQAMKPDFLLALVDARLQLIEGLGYRYWQNTDRYHPYDVVLTIDRNIQREVEQIMDERIDFGAVVVMEPRTGDILAMASRPCFDQNQIEDYLGDYEDAPFNNRSTMAYEPGSVFKTVIAAAAFDQGIVSLFDRFSCEGAIDVGRYRPVRCLMLHACNNPTLIEAFAHSCNTAFIELALKLGPEVMLEYAYRLGLGAKTGILLGERSGNLPLVEELSESKNLAVASIGQFDIRVTPLQVAQMFAIIARGGRQVSPRLVDSLLNRQGRRIKHFPLAEGCRF